MYLRKKGDNEKIITIKKSGQGAIVAICKQKWKRQASQEFNNK